MCASPGGVHRPLAALVQDYIPSPAPRAILQQQQGASSPNLGSGLPPRSTPSRTAGAVSSTGGSSGGARQVQSSGSQVGGGAEQGNLPTQGASGNQVQGWGQGGQSSFHNAMQVAQVCLFRHHLRTEINNLKPELGPDNCRYEVVTSP